LDRADRRRGNWTVTTTGSGRETGKNRKGVALLLVLWAVAVLSILGFDFSFSSRTEVASTIAYSDRVRGRAAAEGAVRRAIVEILYAKARGEDAWKLDGSFNDVSLKYGSARVWIAPEESRIDINRSPPDVLKNLFLQLGVPDDEADALIDAVADWRDADDLVRANGAEESYYGALDPPYEPRNGDFQTVDELLLVRGVTRSLWEGTGGKPGLKDVITVYSPSGRLDPETASRLSLLALPGMTEEGVDELKGMKDDELPPGSILSRARELSPEGAGSIAGASGRVYRIRAVPLINGQPRGLPLEVVITFKTGRPDIVYWNSRSTVSTETPAVEPEDEP